MGWWSNFISGFVSSNKPKAEPKKRIMTGSVIKYTLRSYTNNLNLNIVTGDFDYSILDSVWLVNSYYNYFIQVLDGLKIPNWRKQFDCDKFTRLYVSIIQACHNQGDANTSGVTVGEFWYYDQTMKGGHAIVVAIVDNLKIVFIEPQNGQIKCLTKEEISSCYFCRF